MLLLFALIVGSSSASWAQETGTLTFSSTTTPVNDSQNKSWSITYTGNNFTYDSTGDGCLKIGTNSVAATSLSVTTSGYSTVTITKIQVWATSKANTNVSAKVYIDNNLLGTSSAYTSQTANSGGTEFSVLCG